MVAEAAGGMVGGIGGGLLPDWIDTPCSPRHRDEAHSMSITGTVGYVSPDVGSSYTYYGLDVAVPYKLTDAATLTVGGHYANQNISGLKGNHVWGTVGVTYAF